MAEIHKILTELVEYTMIRPQYGPINGPMETAIQTAVEQIEAQQRERVENLEKEVVRAIGSLQSVEVIRVALLAALTEPPKGANDA